MVHWKPMQIKNKAEIESIEASTCLHNNIQFIKEKFNYSADLVVSELSWNQKDIAIIYIESICESEKIQREILIPLSHKNEGSLKEVLIANKLQTTCFLNECIEALLQGKCIVNVNGQTEIIVLDVISSFQRAISEPENEKVVRGSHEGLIERLQVNLHLIRRVIVNPNLSIKYYTIGAETNTKIALVYMNTIANNALIQEVEKRITNIDVDAIISPNFTEQLIEDFPFSPFPQILNTERIDRIAANLMEGRVVLLSEGNPTALILPVTFWAFYQSPDDYNSRWIVGTFFRLLRLLSFIIAISLPSIYIAITSFHLEVVPNELILPMKNAVKNIPYPPIVEAFLMELTIELLREAGIRLPTPIGQTIGIVGGLVIGDAVVKAGLISNIMIIVVALTAISSFVVPSYELSTTVRLLRFPIMVMAYLFGFIGITFGIMIIFIHLCKIHSFGSPYFAPFAPFRGKDIKDSFVRFPIWLLNQRPKDSLAKKLQQQRTSRE